MKRVWKRIVVGLVRLECKFSRLFPKLPWKLNFVLSMILLQISAYIAWHWGQFRKIDGILLYMAVKRGHDLALMVSSDPQSWLDPHKLLDKDNQ